MPAKTPKELVDYARKNPGKISFGSPGNGSSGHMVGEQFKIMHKLDLVHVPYKGAGPAVIDLVAGHIQMMFDIVPLGARATSGRQGARARRDVAAAAAGGA